MRYDHHKKTQERSLRKEVGGVVVIRAQRYYTTLRLYYILYYLTMHVDRSATEACMYDASAAISSALTLLSTFERNGVGKDFLIRKKKLSLG